MIILVLNFCLAENQTGFSSCPRSQSVDGCCTERFLANVTSSTKLLTTDNFNTSSAPCASRSFDNTKEAENKSNFEIPEPRQTGEKIQHSYEPRIESIPSPNLFKSTSNTGQPGMPLFINHIIVETIEMRVFGFQKYMKIVINIRDFTSFLQIDILYVQYVQCIVF